MTPCSCQYYQYNAEKRTSLLHYSPTSGQNMISTLKSVGANLNPLLQRFLQGATFCSLRWSISGTFINQAAGSFSGRQSLEMKWKKSWLKIFRFYYSCPIKHYSYIYSSAAQHRPYENNTTSVCWMLQRTERLGIAPTRFNLLQ